MAVVKTVGNSGQISLGKEYAGRTVLMDEIEPGVWIIKTGAFIPDSERWMFAYGVNEDIDRAIAWAGKNPPADSDLDALAKKARQ
ncbi:MAG: hypothetical protein ACREXR_07390 [Gammaproteobacteria bacterium]